MIKKILFICFFATCFFPLQSKPSSSNPTLVSKHKNWSVYKVKQGKNFVYYALTYPIQSKGKYSKRGDVYMLITNRPKEKSYNVVSFHAGYPFKNGATAKIKIDNDSFTAFSSGETCWFPDDLDEKVTTSFSKGSKVIVESQSSRGTKTTDIFSLAGSSSALKALKKASGKG